MPQDFSHFDGYCENLDNVYNQTSTRPLANYFDGRSLSIESPLAQEQRFFFSLLLFLLLPFTRVQEEALVAQKKRRTKELCVTLQVICFSDEFSHTMSYYCSVSYFIRI